MFLNKAEAVRHQKVQGLPAVLRISKIRDELANKPLLAGSEGQKLPGWPINLLIVN